MRGLATGPCVADAQRLHLTIDQVLRQQSAERIQQMARRPATESDSVKDSIPWSHHQARGQVQQA